MRALIPAVFLLLFLASGGFTAERRIYEKISSPQLKTILTQEGYTGVEINGSDDLTVTMHNFSVLVMVRGNEYRNIQFRFVARTSSSLDFVNTWNRDKSYTKAYLDSEENPVIEMDIDLTGGVTEERIKDGVSTFRNAMGTFLKDLGLG
jgi:hypothetical protein